MASIDQLLQGFQQFRQQYFGNDTALYLKLKDGQAPNTLMIACCDSRVDPAILTNCQPGELFTLRNVANLVPPSDHDDHTVSAALAFAVTGLKVENIIVMGHSYCGGIKALWEGAHSDAHQFIHSWVSIAEPAKDWVKRECKHVDKEAQLVACEQRSIVGSLANLMTFDFVAQGVTSGKLNIHGWYFDIATGHLSCFDPNTGQFERIT